MATRTATGLAALALAWTAIFGSGAAVSAAPRAADAGVLPLRRVRFYETGVGYFERSGRIDARTHLPIPSAHLDDALKSLVVLGGGRDGRMQGVQFDTLVTEQLGRALARLPTDQSAALDFEALSRSLTGMQVELFARGRAQRGRLLQVLSAEESGLERCLPGQERANEEHQAKDERKPAPAPPPCVLRKEPGLLLLSERDELMRFALADVERVRPVRAADADRLWSAVGGAAQAARAEHALSLRAAPNKAPPRSAGAVPPHQEIALGYVAEAPLWRTTHRLVIADGGQATLQVWALLHNDGDEDWNQVQVELVSGQPDSFLFPVAAPRYARRRLVTLEEPLPSVPQLLDRGADELWDRGEGGESIGLGGIGLSGYGSGAGGYSERNGTVRSGVQESSLLAIGDLAQHAQAEGVEAGALFRYALPEPVDLPARRSLLVPILRAEVPVTRVSYFANRQSAAQSALLFRNATKQTLPAGTVAIFEDGGFGGESGLDRLKPGQQRLLPFGVDLDLELEGKDPQLRQTRRSVSFGKEQLTVHFERVTQYALSLRNRSAQPRRVHLALDLVNNARVELSDAVLTLDDGSVSAVYDVPAQSTREVALRTVEGLAEDHEASELRARLLATLAADPQLPAAQRAVLAQAARELAGRERALARRKQLDHELKLLTDSATRTRQSLPLVAKADPDRGRLLAQRLVDSEARITATERTRTALDTDAPLRQAQRTLLQLNGEKSSD